MRHLNPVFRKDIIPFTIEGYYVRVPKSKSNAFILLKDSVYRPINSNEILAEPTKKIKEDAVDSIAGIKQTPNKFTKKKVIYIVKKGDNLGDIADWFDVTTREVKSWNKLKKNSVNYGQKLTIWVDGSKIGYYKKVSKMTAAQKKKIKKKD
jgi:membrane-bound lytic murein transglycosylase D